MANAFSFKESKLWTKNLATQEGFDRYADARTRLRLSFEKTRDSIGPLVSKISHELPDLTVHDITHLDALWNVADTILGPNFTINPVETYILGLAFLLHDAATSSVAYPGGIEEIKSTVEWTDLVTQRGYIAADLLPNPPKLADFNNFSDSLPCAAFGLACAVSRDFHDVDRSVQRSSQARSVAVFRPSG